MADGPFDPETVKLIPRAPERKDLVELCRELHQRGARFMVVGGFAVLHPVIHTDLGDIDILIDTDLENEVRVYKAIDTLLDGCVREPEAFQIDNTPWVGKICLHFL